MEVYYHPQAICQHIFQSYRKSVGFPTALLSSVSTRLPNLDPCQSLTNFLYFIQPNRTGKLRRLSWRYRRSRRWQSR